MIEALTYEEMLRDINKNMDKYGIKSDTIGILLARPDLETGKSILNSLPYFHFRTGKTINFYLPGYGAYWNDYYPDEKQVVMIDGVNWCFSNQMFANFLDDLEKYANWNYSGESELLLLEYNDGVLSYENVMRFYLDNMIRDGVIASIHSFFEKLFRLCKSKESLRDLSNCLGNDKVKQIARNKILDNLPLGLRDVFSQEKYYCVKKFAK